MATSATILVGVDYSPHADAALRAAAALARELHGGCIAVHVIPGEAGERDPGNIWGSGEDAGQREAERLAAHITALLGAEAEVSALALRGDVGDALLALARERQAAFLALGRIGTSPGGEDRIGTVAQRLQIAAPCPVLLCGPAATAVAIAATPAHGLRVDAVMRPAPVTVNQGETLAHAERLMQQHGVHQLPVVEADRLIGIVSRHDLATQAGYLERSKVDAVMTQRPVTVTPQTTLLEVAERLIEEDVNSLPVVQDGRLIGIVSKTDLLQQLRRMLAS